MTVKAKVAFAAETPLGTAKGGQRARRARRARSNWSSTARSVASKDVPADDKAHDLSFDVPIERSSWVALRHFPQMHTNPVNVIVGGQADPRRRARAPSGASALIEQLWRVRGTGVIAAHERDEAEKTFQRAIEQYRKIADEVPGGKLSGGQWSVVGGQWSAVRNQESGVRNSTFSGGSQNRLT